MLGIIVAMVLAGSLLFAAPSSNSTISFVIILTILMLRAAIWENSPCR